VNWSSVSSLLADLVERPVIVLDDAGAVCVLNLAAERLLDRVRAETIGQDFALLVSVERRDDFRALHAAALDGAPRRGEIAVITGRGERIDVSLELTRTAEHAGIVCHVGVPVERDTIAILIRARIAAIATSAGLSLREREVLDELLGGGSLDEIARALRISARTVRFHQANVLGKLGLISRLELFRLFVPATYGRGSP
jgi:DNA-binding CsgD family transcriptional regulator